MEVQGGLETGSKSLTLTSASWNLDCPQSPEGDERVNPGVMEGVEEEWVKEGWNSELRQIRVGLGSPRAGKWLCV